MEVPDVPGMFTTFHVKQKALFVDLNMFKDINHYSRIMGYDKPLDYYVTENENRDNEK